MRKWLYGTTIVITITLFLLNPTDSEWTAYCENKKRDEEQFGSWSDGGLAKNYALFSIWFEIYQIDLGSMERRRTYLGIFKTFIKMDEEERLGVNSFRR